MANSKWSQDSGLAAGIKKLAASDWMAMLGVVVTSAAIFYMLAKAG